MFGNTFKPYSFSAAKFPTLADQRSKSLATDLQNRLAKTNLVSTTNISDEGDLNQGEDSLFLYKGVPLN